jgi:DNA-binding NarL/FixJ family response regulator
MGILQRLHDSEINASIAISSFFDGAWTVKLADEMNGFRAEAIVASEAEAEAWLDAKARELFPDSIYALSTAGERTRQVKAGPLTPTETTILRALVNGRSSHSIADDLGNSLKTVEVHRTNIRKKLGVSNSFDLAAAAAELGILPESRKRR